VEGGLRHFDLFLASLLVVCWGKGVNMLGKSRVMLGKSPVMLGKSPVMSTPKNPSILDT